MLVLRLASKVCRDSNTSPQGLEKALGFALFHE